MSDGVPNQESPSSLRRWQFSLRQLLIGSSLTGPAALFTSWAWPALEAWWPLLLLSAAAGVVIAAEWWLWSKIQWPETRSLPRLTPRQDATGNDH